MPPPSSDAMRSILQHPLADNQAGLWFLGQAGYVLRGGGVSLAIDPYLSDSVGAVAPQLARAIPVPIQPRDLKVDVFIVTHDHLDHLDGQTIGPYRHKDATTFVAPRLACRKLLSLGVPQANIVCIDSGQEQAVRGVAIRGVYAVPTEPAVIDTTGYRLEFPGGRSVYHTSDTGFSDLLLKAAPKAEVLLACINGKWGNLDIGQAVSLAARVQPKVAIPNHYDMMRLNAADPMEFLRLLRQQAPAVEARVLGVLEPFVW